MPAFWRTELSSIISGTLIAPFVALVVTLVYYRLSGEAALGGNVERTASDDASP